jgi:hypothetical protein
MSLGSIEYNDPTKFNIRTTALVLAFAPVAKHVVDQKMGLFRNEKSHYEESADQTRITVGGYSSIGQYGGSVEKNIDFPLSYDEVKRLLAEGAKKRETVDLTDAKLAALRIKGPRVK